MRLPRLNLPLLAGLLSLVVSIATASPEVPDPLLMADGRRVVTVAAWESLRRPALLEAFRSEIYGRAAVGRPEGQRFEIVGAATPAFDGLAVRRRVRIAYAGPGGEGGINLTCYYPAAATPKGCLLLIVNRSRRIIDEAETGPAEFWPVRDLVGRGYATAAFHYADVATDRKDGGLDSGVFKIFGPGSEARPGDAWGAVAAWSWGASRALDWLETDGRLNGVSLVVVGHSRGGKAALWCGAQDGRVALTISNDSGCTGAALARTTTGETVRVINEKFPHWFAQNYHGYADREHALPVDQHELLGLIAPRRVYVASASDDANAGPRAEFRACVEAGPVFALHGLAGVGDAAMPAPGEARHDGAIGYHLRAGGHDLTREDWRRFMDYADRWLPR